MNAWQIQLVPMLVLVSIFILKKCSFQQRSIFVYSQPNSPKQELCGTCVVAAHASMPSSEVFLKIKLNICWKL